MVTEFYLGLDPTDPAHIPTYHRNILYMPKARWHLAAILHGIDKELEMRVNTYNCMHANHDRIIASPLAEMRKDLDPQGIPLLSFTEIEVIYGEGLKDFFMAELAYVVSTFTFPLAVSSSLNPDRRIELLS